jgi:hypothetical protein
MKTINHWIPAAFCAFISLIALFASINSPDSGWWRPAFFAFLPMCFFFVGSATTQMHRELRELRGRIAELEQQKASRARPGSRSRFRVEAAVTDRVDPS